MLLPFLVRRAAELAATRQVPLQFSTGIGDEDVYLPHADPGLLWPMLRDPRTEDCPVVLVGCYPYVGGAAHLAGTYPQVHMDLSPGIFLAEPIATRMVSEALGLCPPGKLLAGSGRQVRATRASAAVYRCTLVKRDGSWRILRFARSSP